MMAPQTLRVVVTRDGEWWIARCVEFDIVAQSTTQEGVVEEFERTIAARLAIARRKGRLDPFSGLRQGREEVRELFDTARAPSRMVTAKSQLPAMEVRYGR